MRFAFLLVFVTGCLPFALPPGHLRVGAGKTTSEIRREDSMGVPQKIKSVPELTIGMDSTAFAELPWVIEAGGVSDFYSWGTYVEGGYIRRLIPKLRFSATGGAEYWFDGFGVRGGVTLEYVRPFRQGVMRETTGTDSHDRTEYVSAESGTPGIGLFVDGGYRNYDNEKYGFIVFGLSVRTAAFAGYADFTSQH